MRWYFYGNIRVQIRFEQTAPQALEIGRMRQCVNHFDTHVPFLSGSTAIGRFGKQHLVAELDTQRRFARHLLR
jgi:hypothetical protein